MRSLVLVSLSLASGALVSPPQLVRVHGAVRQQRPPMMLAHDHHTRTTPSTTPPSTITKSAATKAAATKSLAPMMLALMASAAPVEAATAAEGAGPLASAFVAYGHYLGLVLFCLCLATERVLIKPDMTKENVELMSQADLVYVISGILVFATGYLRVTEYGKGWDFYQHEPIFWLKLVFAAVLGASSFFPTIKIVQRIGEVKGSSPTASLAPWPSEKLAARMTSVINAEILAVLTIPLSASLMARGVGTPTPLTPPPPSYPSPPRVCGVAAMVRGCHAGGGRARWPLVQIRQRGARLGGRDGGEQ